MNNILKPIILSTLISVNAHVMANNNVCTYIINIDKPEQTIQHFGASDAWSMQFVGLWPINQQNQIADWLFSTANDIQGKPKGIGLSIWRFNLGAGSEEQGEAAQIQSGTRTECFLNKDGSYNWNKQKGQRQFLKLAKNRGVNNFLAFLDSAPVFFTENGLATNTGRKGNINLKKDCYDNFAKYIATSLRGILTHDSIHINYISPVNEPDGHWNWLGPKQEGSPATNREIAKLTKELNKELSKQKIDTKIILNESSDLRCLLGVYETNWQRGNTIHSLFGKDSINTYIGKEKHVASLIAAHSYWTNTPLDFMQKIRMELRDTLRKYNLDYWQTELCIMGNDEEIGGGNGYDFSMKTALYVARIIHHDLVYGNACSWSWWRSIGGDYKDGLLRVYTNDNMKSGTVIDSKLLWSLGNYSRFIRPGAIRYDISALDNNGNIIKYGDTDTNGIMCSAYKNKDGHWVVVAINYSENTKPFCINMSSKTKTSWTQYRTSDISAESLAPIGSTDGNTSLAPRSITSFVSE